MFLHPILLGVGAACVAVPILIHFLMRRRRKPVRWAAMRFVMEAYRQQRRRLRLEQWLLLAVRCVLIALIAVGVARPMFGGGAAGGERGSREVYLLVDNGIASATAVSGGDGDGSNELAVSVDRAVAQLRGLDPARGDRAALISLGGPARGVVLPATADMALVERRLRELASVDSETDLAGGLALVPEAEAGEGVEARRVVAVFSAFREGTLGGGMSVGAAAALGGAELVVSPPAEADVGNVGLVGVEALRPVVVTGAGAGGEGAGMAGASQVRVRLVRSGAGVDREGRTVARITAATETGLREVGVVSVAWAEGQEVAEVLADVDLSALGSGGGASGRVVLRVELEPDANERDNAAWAVIELRERLRVAVVGTRRFGARPRISSFVASDWLVLALEPGGEGQREQIEVEVLDAARIGSGALAGFDAVIVAEPGRVGIEGWTAMGVFAARGGTVLLTSSATPGAQLWTEDAARALELPWLIAREPVESGEGEGVLRARPAGEDDLLWYVRGELEELSRSVSVSRLLDVRAEDEGDVLLETAEGRPVLVVSHGGGVVSGDGGESAMGRRGLVALLATAVDLAWTDLPARPLMVPMVQELVRSGAGADARDSSVVAGARASAPVGAVELSRLDGREGIVSIEAATGRTRGALQTAGVLVATDIEGAGVGAVAVQPDAMAARVGPTSRERVVSALVGTGAADDALSWSDGERASVEGAAARVRSDVPGPGLMILLGALGLACVELWLARVASHAAAPAGGVAA